MHPRNRHQGQYNLTELKTLSPSLEITKSKYGQDTIDFTNPTQVKLLNQALLKSYYGVTYWDIPEQFLCPPIPGRADYIHTIADLIGTSKKAAILDIGTGANCIYPIIGVFEYGWSFVGTDINPLALEAAEKIIQTNSTLKEKVRLRLQKNVENIFKGIITPEDRFDCTMCNPPFHASLAEAQAGTKRKWKNLARPELKGKMNFGGQGAELWCEGGEMQFISKMIRESVEFSQQCTWFSSLVSKEDNLPQIYKKLKEVQAKEVRTLDMAQGTKKSRIVAWSF